MVVSILGILALLITQAFPRMFQAASKARCISNMRNVHIALSGYLDEKRVWPQIPENEEDPYDPRVESYWIESLKPYTESEEVWLCPVLKAAQLKGPSGNVLRMHYVPTRFDANPASPRRWSTQPWLVEIADAHGDGALISFPDGRIQSMGEVFRSIPKNPQPQ